jgi:diphosphomevalonate decarboxylase
MATSEHNGRATARAGANFALVKYWGKADARLNVPAVGSISITLDALFTETSRAHARAAQTSSFSTASGATTTSRRSPRVSILRRKAGVDTRPRRKPQQLSDGAGLASSASGSRRSCAPPSRRSVSR